ncbi:MAG: uracil-DNA glycosylase [Actinomycetota bacterium]|nr:uracil-DNA glycosylase [Actinomycetota bacterium]
MTAPSLLEMLERRAQACRDCPLAAATDQVVFGDGDPHAQLMLIGEAPGYHEDRQGIPFVGAAGQLLNRLLGEVDLERPDVYITNVLKRRPPGNRDPLPAEIEACKGYLAEQIRLVDPKVVMTLGVFSTKLLLKRSAGVGRLRGQAYPWWNRLVVPTFHPAAALRGGVEVVSGMREDFALVRKLLDEELTGPAEQLDLFG